ncbi:MAG: TetR family transcriptional regulator [Myxococcota bacterium]
MATRKQLDPEATRQAILKTAAELFAEHGFDGVSVAQLAKAAGVTKSLVHHHFGSKAELWQAAKLQRFSSYADIQRATIGNLDHQYSSGLDVLDASIQLYFRALEEDPIMRRMMMWSHLEDRDEQPLEVMNDLVRYGLSRIEQSQASGELRDDVPAHALLHCVLGVSQSWFMMRDLYEQQGAEPDHEELVAALRKILRQGMAP